MTHRMFVAFAGGGAKGLIHLGALRALEAQGVQFKGLSGTSAGALVATLKASGFTASDLLNPDTGHSIITSLGTINPKIRRAHDLFGRVGWWRICLFRKAIPNLAVISLSILLLFGFFLILTGWLFSLGMYPIALAILAGLSLFALLTVRTFLSGLAQSTVLSSAL